MKILITGGAGFIGSNLAYSLIKNGFEVIGIDNLSYGVYEQIPKEVIFHKADIRDKNIYDLFDDVECIFHLAAKNSILDCENNPYETSDINVNGTINIFDGAVKNNIKKVIYAESSAVYEGSSNLPSKESDVSPQSVYAKSKIAATWGCLTLGLMECRSDIENLLLKSTWEPLRWTCAEVLREL